MKMRMIAGMMCAMACGTALCSMTDESEPAGASDGPESIDELPTEPVENSGNGVQLKPDAGDVTEGVTHFGTKSESPE